MLSDYCAEKANEWTIPLMNFQARQMKITNERGDWNLQCKEDRKDL